MSLDRSIYSYDYVTALNELECVFNIQKLESKAFLLSLHVPPYLRNNKYGTFLLYCLADYCLANDIKIIELDDMSTRFMKPSNIYVQAGFTYLEPFNCEMSGHTVNIYRNTYRALTMKTEYNLPERYIYTIITTDKVQNIKVNISM